MAVNNNSGRPPPRRRMFTMSSPTMQIDVDTLMARIRAEVARRKLGGAVQAPGDYDAAAFASGVSMRLSPLPVVHLAKPGFTQAERYHLNDFLALHDQEFVDAAYRGVLKRNSDGPGLQHFLDALRRGRLSKIEILGRLRYSPEGRRVGVPVAGLLPAFLVQHSYRLPIIGSVVAWATAFVRLPKIARSLQGFENYQHQRNAQLEASIRHLAEVATANERYLGQSADRTALTVASLRDAWDAMQISSTNLHGDLSREIAASANRLAQAQTMSAAGMEQRIDALESHRSALKSEIADLVSGNEVLQERLATLESHKREIKHLLDVTAVSQQTSTQLTAMLREALDALESRVDGLGGRIAAQTEDARVAQLRMIERVARLEGKVHEQRLSIHAVAQPETGFVVEGGVAQTTVSHSRFDALYFAFEQRFRGSREEIRQRLTYYLPLLRDSVVCKAGATLVDLGCGRGEWLELLRDEHIDGRGVDTNPEMAKECVERGLQVDVGDAIAYLKQLPDNALGAVTGFHIIEHVSLNTLIELIEEAHRVVQPGGLVIFETPNPENVAVGACNFYIDPTHQRPLPPVLTQFLVEAGGFIDVVVHRVNSELLPPVFGAPTDEDSPVLRATVSYLEGKFLCAPDYSVVGRVA